MSRVEFLKEPKDCKIFELFSFLCCHNSEVTCDFME